LNVRSGGDRLREKLVENPKRRDELPLKSLENHIEDTFDVRAEPPEYIVKGTRLREGVSMGQRHRAQILSLISQFSPRHCDRIRVRYPVGSQNCLDLWFVLRLLLSHRANIVVGQ